MAERVHPADGILHLDLANGYTISIGSSSYHYRDESTVEVAMWYNEPSGGQPWVRLQEHDEVQGSPDELVKLLALVQRIGSESGRITAIDPKLWRAA